MTHPVREALRERLTLRAVLTWVVGLGMFWLLIGSSPIQFATTVAAMGVFGLIEFLSDAYDLRESVTRVGLGVHALLTGSAMFAGRAMFAAGDATVWLSLAFLAVGGWLVLDAVQTVRHEGATVETDPLDGREVYHDYVGRQIHEALDERPRTRRELAETLDADDDAIDAALEKLRARDVVVRVGSELRVRRSEERSPVERTRDRAVGVARRMARPATIEFADHGSAGGDHAGNTDDVATHRNAERGSDATTSDRDHERDPAR